MSARSAAVTAPRTVRVVSRVLAACACSAAVMTVAPVFAWMHFGQVGGPFVVSGMTSAVISLLWAWLAVAVRVPRRRWPQVTTWVASVVGMVSLLVVLGGGLFSDGTGAYLDFLFTARDLLGYDLAPAWYPIVSSVTGITTLLLMGVGALLLTRADVIDFYRKASWQRDDRWADFVAGQQDRMANGS